ncbi:MAG: putative Glutathionylspermidine synthase, partial [Rhodospirillaceae bacterium]
MKRIVTVPRADWQAGLSVYAYGAAAAAAARGWDESVCYEFSANQIDMIEGIADEVHGLIQDAVRHVIDNHLLALIGFPLDMARMVSGSWKTCRNRFGGPCAGLFGRLDFAYDGRDSLKLIGACYDGPCGLFAASIVQWNWLEAHFPEAGQFNGLHEGLVDRWQALAVGKRDRSTVHLVAATP